MRLMALLLLGLVGVGDALAGNQFDPAEVAALDSPDGRTRISIGLDEGRASWRASRDGEPLFAPSRLGFLFADTEQLQRNLEFVGQTRQSHDATWTQPWGEWQQVRDHYNELTVTFRETQRGKRELRVVFRAFNEGIAFRTEFRTEGGWHDVRIAEELTEFNLAPEGEAWWIPGGEWNRYEYLYNHTPIREVGTAHTPITFRTASGTHLAIHEAALVDYSAMWLRRVEDQRFKAQLSPGTQGWKVRRQAPFATPWRAILIADSAAALYAANPLFLNLNEPNALGDVSWFTPHKYVGVWWELHLENTTWARGPKHGATTENTRRYIDFAAANGFRGVLVEGWNVGWDGQWFGDGNDFDFTQPTEDFDLEGLTAYARERGVRLIGHHETGAAVSHYEAQLDGALDLYARLGVDSIKTGYVGDAGQIERTDADGTRYREWHDGQWQANHHLRVVREAAERHIAINPHEPIKDTGLRRTYPNWVSREGARGMEYAAWGHPQNPPEHELNLVFTRMLSGPMDYTPGIVSLQGRHNPIPSTLAKQLALYVVLYSPIQMVADLPEHYAAQPEAFEFIRQVPTDWVDTRVLNGAMGDYVTFARRARDDADWYLGALTDEQPRTLSVVLDFLEAGRTYTAHVYRDSEGAHFETNRFAFTRETRSVRHGDTLELTLAPGGGMAVWFEAE